MIQDMDLHTLTKLYNDDFNASNNKASLEEFAESKRYYHGNQLPDDVRADLRERGQPVYVENIYKKHANKIQGFNQSGRQEMNVKGTQKEDRDLASLLNDLCRTITDSTAYQLDKSMADEDLQHGIAIMEPIIREKSKTDMFGHRERAVEIAHVSARSFLVDRFSKKPDASDAKVFHKLIWADVEDVEATLDMAGVETYWLPNGMGVLRERVLLTVTWLRSYDKVIKQHIWRRVIWHTNGIVYEDPDIYDDHPYAIRKLYIDDETNQWYGLFRDIKPIQDSVNFSNNRMFNMLGSVKILYETGAVPDANTFADSYSEDNSVTPVNDGALSGNRVKEIKHTTEIAQLSTLVSNQAKKADDQQGLNDEMLATAVNRMSGEGIRERVKLGLVSINNFITASDQLDVIAFSKAIKLMQKYFTAEQVFRIAEKDNAERYFTINEIEKNEDGSVVYENSQPKRKNRLEIGEYDIKITTTQATEGASSERYRNGVEMLKVLERTRPDAVPHAMPLLLRENDSPIAQDFIDIIKKLDEAAANDPKRQKDEELQQMIKELQVQSLELKNMLMEKEGKTYDARGVKLVADAGAKSVKSQIDQKEAGLDLQDAQQ